MGPVSGSSGYASAFIFTFMVGIVALRGNHGISEISSWPLFPRCRMISLAAISAERSRLMKLQAHSGRHLRFGRTIPYAELTGKTEEGPKAAEEIPF